MADDTGTDRPSTPRCIDCKFSDMDIEDDLMTVICRRYPPHIVDISDTAHAADSGHNAGIVWPVVSDGDWCGEFVQVMEVGRG